MDLPIHPQFLDDDLSGKEIFGLCVHRLDAPLRGCGRGAECGHLQRRARLEHNGQESENVWDWSEGLSPDMVAKINDLQGKLTSGAFSPLPSRSWTKVLLFIWRLR